MPTVNALHPPIQYAGIWALVGSLLLVAVAAWLGVLYWQTRRRQIASLATLRQLPPARDLAQLKAKYLQLIDECYQSYQQHQTDQRGLHRGLSMAVRYFVYEARQFPAPRLTLMDLKKAPYPNLTAVIEQYYGDEFAPIERGDPAVAVEAAKRLVQQWV